MRATPDFTYPLSHWKNFTTKYRDYQERGFLVLLVTLTTGVKSDSYAKNGFFITLWTKHFLEKLEKRLPKNRKAIGNTTLIDHNFVTEKSDPLYPRFHPGLTSPSWVPTVPIKGWRSMPDSPSELYRPGFWHFHGIVAVHPIVRERFWNEDGLNKHLCDDLKSFGRAGSYRPCRLTSFLLEPPDDIEDWIGYMLKRRQEKGEIL